MACQQDAQTLERDLAMLQLVSRDERPYIGRAHADGQSMLITREALDKNTGLGGVGRGGARPRLLSGSRAPAAPELGRAVTSVESAGKHLRGK